MSHDQNFKNLVLDYPRAALALFAAAEAATLDTAARIVPVRQEQLQAPLGERFGELDIPLLVEWDAAEHALAARAPRRGLCAGRTRPDGAGAGPREAAQVPGFH